MVEFPINIEEFPIKYPKFEIGDWELSLFPISRFEIEISTQ